MAGCFTAKAVISADGARYADRAAFIDAMAEILADVRTVHHGFMPEISFSGPDEADGIWAMDDYLVFPSAGDPIGFRGYGHYHETYVRPDGGWRFEVDTHEDRHGPAGGRLPFGIEVGGRRSAQLNMADEQAPGPLAGVCVIDVGTRISAPFCAGLLGEMGANVIKIEDPRGGDFMRTVGPFAKADDGTDYSIWWAIEGRGRKGVTLDLRSKKGQELFRRLTAKADIVCENFRPGTLESWGIAPQDCDPRLDLGPHQRVRSGRALFRPAGSGPDGDRLRRSPESDRIRRPTACPAGRDHLGLPHGRRSRRRPHSPRSTGASSRGVRSTPCRQRGR